MSTLLSTIASVIEKNVENLITKPLESALGAVVGKEIAKLLFHKKQGLPEYYPNNRSELLSSSVYGMTIPKVYGTIKVEGRIIWAQPIKHHQHHEVSYDGTSEPKHKLKISHSATLAVSICAGPIHEVSKIWADNKPLNMNTLRYRLYNGTETQEPDKLLEEYEGNAPAYRGIAYMVIEGMPLTNYNNRMPNFVFEVTSYPEGFLQNHVSQKINAIHVTGNGEFTYDTTVQTRVNTLNIDGKKIPHGIASKINGAHGKSSAIAGLDSLRNTLPNIRWIAVTVYWFASHSDIEESIIRPGTIYDESVKTVPDSWQVAHYTAANAFSIPYEDGKPKYEGTVGDISLKRFLSELRARKYKIMLQVKLIVTSKNGTKITCGAESASAASHIYRFFIRQYQPFVKHYCTLAKNMIDAFVIASGMSELTGIKDVNNKYPAVEALKQLAEMTKNTLGTDVVVTYAADYEEYHSHNGIYNMDELWASSSIDVIGINAYFPLLHTGQCYDELSVESVSQLWKSGEGYRYFYSDPANKTTRERYQNQSFAWKNIPYWWRTKHASKGNSSGTQWKPRSKRIWFIEYGFRSVTQDKSFAEISANHPTQEDRTLYTASYAAQKIAIEGTLKAWNTSKMVEVMFLYSWDINHAQIPTDALEYKKWQYSHCVNNKLTLITLTSIIQDALKNAGIVGTVRVSENVHEAILGYAITRNLSVQDLISELQTVYSFDLRESDGQLVIAHENPESVVTITASDIGKGSCTTTYEPDSMDSTQALAYLSMKFDYQTRLQKYRTYQQSHGTDITLIPLVLDDEQAEKVVNQMHNRTIAQKTIYEISLPIKHLQLDVGDVVLLKDLGHAIKITDITVSDFLINVRGHRCPIRHLQ
ncbi:glycoside hydrolase TIM-barrel-like domain-containing protein [Candidatus Anaplasma sp. TIGMIC]|uniref:glycoside hydrolase/phage tail family protein n=1 Tax=Candidatus Anaplasma sp. TIGMIC TaxID=3020713 RepID=UPI00232BE557|nr:glycoside hydrolase TIM-barrel-like domain-containing protein [Candidatus Anaplasma sp. TIGMIC]MDB1135102.1 glycoside hydrolase TIM-barrel-like domain-containing protein [Candidatus Anaplasma sp. TIGMIC]